MLGSGGPRNLDRTSWPGWVWANVWADGKASGKHLFQKPSICGSASQQGCWRARHSRPHKFEIHRRLSKLSQQPLHCSGYFLGEEARSVQKPRWSLGSTGFSAPLPHHQLPQWAALSGFPACWQGNIGLLLARRHWLGV